METLLGHEETARILGISPQTLGREVEDGKITPVWVRGQRRYEPCEVRAYVERGKNRADATVSAEKQVA